MKIAGICTDDATGPGHALLEFDSSEAELLKLAFFDLDRHQYLWPSAGRTAIWRKQVQYFAVSRASVDAPVFRLGPEVCNHLQADSLVKITSRDGLLDAQELVWPGVLTLDTAFEESAVVPVQLDDDNRVTVEHSPRIPTTARPTTAPSPSRTTAGASDDVSIEQASLGPALEIDIGMAVISDHLAEVPLPGPGSSVSDPPPPHRLPDFLQTPTSSRVKDPAPEGAFDSDSQRHQETPSKYWAIVALLVSCIVTVALLLSYRPLPDGRYRVGQTSSHSLFVHQAFKQHSGCLEGASPAERS